MHHRPHELEQALCRLMQRQSEEYKAAHGLLSGLGGAVDNLPQLTETVPEIHAVLETFAQTAAEVERARQAWSALGTPAGEELRRAVDRQRALLEEMLATVGRVQVRAADAREKLIPLLDDASRGRQMQSAYHRSLSQA